MQNNIFAAVRCVFCGILCKYLLLPAEWNCSFSNANDELRHVTTNSIQIGPSYVIQFDLRMGCSLPYAVDIDNEVASLMIHVHVYHVMDTPIPKTNHLPAVSHLTSTCENYICYQVELEFSRDHGMTWQQVRAGCWPPRMCDEYHEPSVYQHQLFRRWRRVTLTLPPHNW